MSFAEITLLAVGLSMDSLAVSVTSGAIIKKCTSGQIIRIASVLAFFQALFTLTGYLLGFGFIKLIEAFAMNFLRPLPQRDSSGADFTYLWAKKNLRFKYDLFFVNYSASNILDGITAVVFDGENRSECDHRPVYIDFPMPR